jgi:YD repeat-containing protein
MDKRTGRQDGSGSTSWVYDARGRVSSETKVIGTESFTTSYTYNSSDQPLTMVYPDNEVVNLAYNYQGTAMSLASSINYVSAAFYDEAGRMRTLKLGGTSGSPVLTRPYSYNSWSTATDGGMLNTLVSTNQQSTTWQSLVYDYNNDLYQQQIRGHTWL